MTTFEKDGAKKSAALLRKSSVNKREKAAVRRWLHGHAAAAASSRQATAEAGPDPKQTITEAPSAVRALAAMGLWPGPCDPASEAAVVEVRRRWACIQQRAVTEPDEHELERADRDLVAPWMAIGGIMVVAHFASDIDAAIRGAEHDAAINAGDCRSAAAIIAPARSWR